MTNAETNTLVFKDQSGDYYLVPLETLERGRVPAERRAEVERLVAEADDVQGHALILFLCLVAVAEVVAIGIGISGPMEPRPLVHPERAGRPFE